MYDSEGLGMTRKPGDENVAKRAAASADEGFDEIVQLIDTARQRAFRPSTPR